MKWITGLSGKGGVILNVLFYVGFAWLIVILVASYSKIQHRFQLPWPCIMWIAGAVYFHLDNFVAGGFLLSLGLLFLLIAIKRWRIPYEFP
jgi:hypothetical protein